VCSSDLYAQWRVAAAAAGVAPATAPIHHDDFFADATMRGWYRAWVSALVGRVNAVTGVAYRDDPTIFAWELANEVACTNASVAAPCVAPNGTSPLLRAWVAEMSAHIKAADGNHMVSVGDEGFWGADDTGGTPCPSRQWWCDGSAGDWLGLLRLPGVDFGSVHLYPDSFKMQEWGVGAEDAVACAWIANHTRAAHARGKPVLFGEFGHGAAGLAQHAKYALYTAAAEAAGADGWAVWMLASLEGDYSRQPAWPSWWRGGDAELQVYCAGAGDPPPPGDGAPHDPDTCAVLAAAAARLRRGR
jgi:mannan endo-1,4-beta-mannosidase